MPLTSVLNQATNYKTGLKQGPVSVSKAPETFQARKAIFR